MLLKCAVTKIIAQITLFIPTSALESIWRSYFEGSVQFKNNGRYAYWLNLILFTLELIHPQSNHHAGNNSWGPWNDWRHDKTLSRTEEADKRQWMDTYIVRY